MRHFRFLRLRQAAQSPHALPLSLICLFALAAIIVLRCLPLQNTTTVLAPALFGHSIIIDAGHGGWDPGVVGVSGSYEKDINLEIAKKLAELLRSGGATVTMTRESDIALAESKHEDICARLATIPQAEAELLISIHGNSYPADPHSQGAQVFYYPGEAESQALAFAVQERLGAELGSQRVALAHSSTYLLKHANIPAIIAEMGFISNAEEEQLLLDPNYQWRAAWALYAGIVQYLEVTETPQEATTI